MRRTTTFITGLALIALAAAAGPTSAKQQSGYVSRIDNPYFPLAPGTSWTLRGEKDGEPTRDVMTVTDRTIVISGVRCRVVHDELFMSGRLAERTDDYYAQDRKGNVHYFGEDTAELDENGNVTSTEGTWRDGRQGARNGIIMLAHPKVGQRYEEEFFKGHAEDHAQIISRKATLTVPFGSFKHVLQTKNTTPLEPGVVENKWYAKGVGVIAERDLKGGTEHDELVSMTRPGGSRH